MVAEKTPENSKYFILKFLSAEFFSPQTPVRTHKYCMQLRELFKPSPVSDQHVNSWEWRYRNDEFAQALFKVGNVVYMFSASSDNDQGDDGDWSIEFQSMKKFKGVSGFDNTGTGNEVEVFNTVIDIIKTLLADLGDRVQRLNFSAATTRRQSLYARMAHRLLPTWKLDQYGDHFALTKPTPVAAPKPA